MLSVVIPAFNAGATLGACLDCLDGADEVIVVDGGSTDDTVAIAERANICVISSPRGRGVQLSAGACAAHGDWLLFVHADTRLAAGWYKAVAAHIPNHPEHAACFRFQLDDRAWQARIIEAGVTARVRLLGLPYGDQGLLISRALYEAVGGYRPLPLMEDVDLVERIGRQRLRTLPVDAVTSSKRWQRDGWIRRSARNLCCLLLYRLGVSPTRIAQFYG